MSPLEETRPATQEELEKMGQYWLEDKIPDPWETISLGVLKILNQGQVAVLVFNGPRASGEANQFSEGIKSYMEKQKISVGTQTLESREKTKLLIKLDKEK